MGVEIPLLLSPVIPPGNMRGARTGACTLGGVVSLTTPEHGDLTAADRDTVTELSALPGGWSAEQDHPDLAVYAVERPPRVRTLVDIFQETCQHHPETVAIQGEDDEITYQELEELVDIQAQQLWDRGIGRGDRVGIRVPSGTTDLDVAILATLAAGAAYVPVDADDQTLERRRSGQRPRWRPSSARTFVGCGDRRAPGRSGTTELLGRCWIIFTSGSTGTPKGVAVSHRSAAALVDAEALMYLRHRPLAPEDRVMAGLSVAFDASCEEMWLAWRHGATLVAAAREVVRSGEDLGRWIVQERITAVSTVPTLASLWPSESLSAVRLLIFGGEACPMSLVQRLAHPGREVWNTYGPTETTVIASGQLLSVEPPIRIGRPVPGWRLAVVDPDGVPVRWGDTGELVIAGVGLGRYLDQAKDPEKFAPLPREPGAPCHAASAAGRGRQACPACPVSPASC